MTYPSQDKPDPAVIVVRVIKMKPAHGQKGKYAGHVVVK